MSLLTKMLDLVTFRDLPANRDLETRALGSTPIAFQTGRPVWPRHDVSTFNREGYKRASTIFRCVQFIANSVGEAPLRIYSQLGEEKSYDEAHAFRQLMHRPNDLMGEARFLSFVTMVMAVTGFCVIEKERARASNVIGLWPLRSDWIKPILRKDAAPDWEYTIPGHEPHVFKADDVIALTYADEPGGGPTGIGPLEVALRSVGLHNVMMDFLKTFFDRGALPLYMVIPSDDPRAAGQWKDQAKVDAFKAAFAQRYQGLNHSVEPAFGFGIKEIQRVGLNFNELAWPDLRALTDLDICNAFGIAPGLIGVRVGVENLTYSNYAQSRRSFYEDVISPLWGRIDDAFTHSLLPEFEPRPQYSLEFDVTGISALQDNENERWQRATDALRAGGISTHMFQREIGLKPIGADVFLRGLSTIEVPVIGSNGSRRNDHLIEGRFREVAPKALTDGVAFRRLPAEQRAQLNRTAVQTIIKLGEQGAPLVRRFFKEQGQRIVAEVMSGLERQAQRVHWEHEEDERDQDRTATGQWSYLCMSWRLDKENGILRALYHEKRALAEIDWGEEDRLLSETLRRVWIAAGEASFDAASDLLGVDLSWDLANPNVGRVLDNLAHRVVDINATTRDDIARVVGQALDDGVTLDELADRLTGLFDETYQGRSMTIARTESQVAYNSASVLGYAESGVVSMAELLDNPDHTEDYGASDGYTCAGRNGLIVPLERVSHHIAAEHPNGTLAVAPVLSTLGAEGAE